MAESQGVCPVPHGDESAAAGSCPVPHGGATGPDWDPQAHAEAMRRAREAADAGHTDAERAQEMAVRAAEQRASRRGVSEIQSQFLESLGKKLGYGHPLSDRTGLPQFTWTPEAEERLSEVPEFCRELTRWRVEWTALKQGLGTTITPEVMEVKYRMWGEVSDRIQARRGAELPWTESARERFQRVPDFVKGQVLEAVEGNARSMGATLVDDQVVDAVIERWSASGDFHEGLYGFR